MPNTLGEAEKLLAQHEGIKNEIRNYEEDYQKMRDMGEMVSQGSKCQSAGLGPPTQMIAAFVHLADLCGHYNNKKRGLQPNGPRATIARDAFLLPSGPCGCGIELVSFKADGG